jgi:hypothetical protein
MAHIRSLVLIVADFTEQCMQSFFGLLGLRRLLGIQIPT